MRELPGEHRETIGGVDVHMVHGSPLAVNDFMWESLADEELARARRARRGADVLLCTHTGIPWQRRVDGTLVVNVGAVGRPANDGRTDTWYAIVDLGRRARRAPSSSRVAYDWRAQAASMRAAGLPEPFAETVETGWWTTCLEIVPPRERARGRYQRLPRRAADLAASARSSRCSARRCSRRGCGSTRTSTATWPARTARSASSPQARKRSLGLERFRALVDEAVAEGFEEIYVTGGEPFVEPAIVDMLEYATDAPPTVVLTNAMLFTGRRASRARAARRPRPARAPDLDRRRPRRDARPLPRRRARGAGDGGDRLRGARSGCRCASR